jgi:hypothetical protein
MIERFFTSIGASIRKSLLLVALAVSLSCGTHADAQNLIFTFTDDGEGGTKVVASGGTATAVGASDNSLIGVRSSSAGGDTGFGFLDDAFPFAAFSSLFITTMSDPMILVSGGGLASGEITQSVFTVGVFTPLWMVNSAGPGATLSAVGAPDPEGTLDIPYSAFASLDGRTIVNSEDGWEFRFGAPAVPAVEAPGVLRLSSIRTFGPTLVGRKSRSQIVRITNTGQSEVDSISVNIRGRASGEFDATTPVSSLAAGESTSTKVVFEPKGKGTRRATLNISSSVGIKTLSLAGRGKVGYQVPRAFPKN